MSCSVTCGGQPKRSQLEIRFLFSNRTDFFSSSSAKIMMLLVEGVSWKQEFGGRRDV